MRFMKPRYGGEKIMELILAQGAQHTKPEKLAGIIAQIKSEMKIIKCKDISIIEDKIKYYIPNISDTSRSRTAYSVNQKTYTIEEKYDGFSYLNVEGRFFSKTLSSAQGTKGQPVEKTANIPHLADITKKVYEQCGADLHGELYMMDGISDDVTKIMGCTPDKAIARTHQMFASHGANGVLHYMLIDIRAIFGKSLINEPHRLRHAILLWVYHTYIRPLDPYNYIRMAEEYIGDPNIIFRSIVRRGGEGIIIKREDALYIPGKKPANNWIKGKKKITHDVFMTGLNEGTGKNKYLFGSIEFAHLIDGKIVKCGNCSSGLSDDIREYIYNNADAMIRDKQVFEIEAIQESQKSFRNAVFLRLRTDKHWTECTPVSIRIKEDLI